MPKRGRKALREARVFSAVKQGSDVLFRLNPVTQGIALEVIAFRAIVGRFGNHAIALFITDRQHGDARHFDNRLGCFRRFGGSRLFHRSGLFLGDRLGCGRLFGSNGLAFRCFGICLDSRRCLGGRGCNDGLLSNRLFRGCLAGSCFTGCSGHLYFSSRMLCLRPAIDRTGISIL